MMSFRLISVRGGVSGGVITSKSVIGGTISTMPVSGDVKSTIFVSAV